MKIQRTKVETLSVDEMKNTLANEGYVIQTEAEWNEQLAAAKTEENADKNRTRNSRDRKKSFIVR